MITLPWALSAQVNLSKRGLRDMEATVSIWGVRGALPMPDRRCVEYGGNTSCVSLDYGDGVLCFDAGSGLLSLMECLDGVKRLDILISHVHIDHIMGLYWLSGCTVPEIHLYGEARRGVGFRAQLEAVTGRPYWPVELRDLSERVSIHEIAPGGCLCLPRDGGALRVSWLRGNHPDGSLLYRAELEGKRVTYALDCELGGKMAEELAEFARGSSLLIWDANFTQADKRDGWGHSTWEEGLAVGRAAGAERILMTHYSRDYTDSFLREQELLAQREDSACIFAREGMVIAL